MKEKKSKNVNSENKKSLFFFVGLLVSSALVLLAFEWTTFNTQDHLSLKEVKDKDDIDLFIMPNLQEEKLEIEKPKIENPKPLQVKNPLDFETIDSDEGDENDDKQDALFNDGWEDDGVDPSLLGTSISIVDEKIYEFVTEMPIYPGGETKMYEFLKNKVRYPSADIRNNKSGKVYVSFVVNKKGEISEAKVLSAPTPTLGAEAIRVVNNMPDWLPGKNNGKKVNVRFILPIEFKLR